MTHATLQVEQQCHGYRGGHQLLASSAKLSREDQDTIDRLSDISGSLRPDERFAPYLTFYPLPSAKYYVVAKTWQDLNARRAGCVLTRSLLVRAEDWVEFESVLELVDLLRPVDRDDLSVEALTLDTSVNKAIPAIPPAQTLEIVEALFLEERQPVVVFGATEPELIIVRLVTALWPGLKRIFSACSFALTPRTVAGKSFDIVFSPKESRSRFANWEGRRVDGAGLRDRAARHRWSVSTARIIFEDPHPSLAKLDALGVLARDVDGDESRLRLSLLWNDLLDQLRNSPTALLGMLDILHSQQSNSDFQYDITGAIGSALTQVERLPAAKQLEFLIPLCSKLGDTPLPIHVAVQLQKAVGKLASADLHLVGRALSSIPPDGRFATRLFFAGAADGIVAAAQEFLKSKIYSFFDDGRLSLLMATNERFARELIGRSPGNQDVSWTERLSRAVDAADSRLSADDLARILRNLNANAQAPLLRAYLHANKASSFSQDLKVLWEGTEFKCEAFDNPLLESADDRDRLIELRQFLGALPNTSSTERLLYSSLTGTATDMEWALSSSVWSVGKRSKMISIVLERCNDAALAQVASTPDLVGAIIDFLSNHQAVQPHAKPYLKVLSWTQFDIDRILRVAKPVLNTYHELDKKTVLQNLAYRGLRFAQPSSNALICELLSDAHFEVDPDALVDSAVSKESATERISDNLGILNQAPLPLRREMLRYIDNLSIRLSEICPGKLTDSGILAWADLIRDSETVNPIGQLRAAGIALSFAFTQREKDVSPLVVVSFPLVYRELKRGNDTPSLWIRFFSDWDRCKTLRKELITSSINSAWPRAAFIRSALSSGDLEKILAGLLKDERGREYLALLTSEMNHLAPDDRQSVERTLTRLLSHTENEAGR